MAKTKKPNIQYTIRYDLCTGCGICVDMCPSHAIGMQVDKGVFRPHVNEETCRNRSGCHRCFDVCPGLGIDLLGSAKQLFDSEQCKRDKFAGHYLKCHTGFSNDNNIRYHGASGGMVTQFLTWLLENGHIDGAVVTCFDKESPLKVNSFIATTPDEIKAAKSSKYSPVSLSGIIRDIKRFAGNKLVVVGLPCHIQGFRKAERMDAVLRSKIVGHFAIYCSSSRTFGFTRYVLKERGIDLDSIDYLAYRDMGNQGGLVVKGKDKAGKEIDYYQDYRKYSHPLRSIFVPRRCLLCVDHYGELADISFGDINTPPYNEDKTGINSIVVRSCHWEGLLSLCEESGAITLGNVSMDVVNRSQPSARMKKGRNVEFISLLKQLGCKIPTYGNEHCNGFTAKAAIQYVANRAQQYIGRHEYMWGIIKYIKKKS